MIKSHPTGYNVSSDGVVYSIRNPNIPLTTFVNNSGYLTVCLKGKTLFVHRVVVETFIGKIPTGKVVNHIDGNKLNNKLDNLEITTYSENSLHSFSIKKNLPQSLYLNGQAKLNLSKQVELLEDILAGKTNVEIGEKFNLHSRYISLIRHKKRWRKLWKSLEEYSNTIEETPISSGHLTLSIEECVAIILLLPKYTNKQLSDMFNLDPSTISRVRSKKQWVQVWDLLSECNE